MEKNLYYFCDPMCSWCYGFSDDFKKIFQIYKNQFEIKIIAGGLNPYETRITPPHIIKDILHHWEEVNRLTGKVFDFNFFDRNQNFIYDTAPSCKAVLTAQIICPEQVFNYFYQLQIMFYKLGYNPTKMQTFEEAAKKTGISISKFNKYFYKKETDNKLKSNINLARSLFIYSYPTIMIYFKNNHTIINQGYINYLQLAKKIEYFFCQY